MASLRQAQTEDRWCSWCGTRIDVARRPQARYCSNHCRMAAFGAKPCVYCGLPADTRDHFVPKAFREKIQDLGWVRNRLIVPACNECNRTAGDKVFRTMKQKRGYIHERYRIKYRRILEMPSWSDEDLEELGYGLRTTVVAGLNARLTLRERLRWPAR